MRSVLCSNLCRDPDAAKSEPSTSESVSEVSARQQDFDGTQGQVMKFMFMFTHAVNIVVIR